MKRYALYIALMSCALGIVLEYYVPITVALAVLSLAIASTTIGGYKKSQIVILVLICFSVGCVRSAVFKFFEIDHRLDEYIGTEISCDGIIIDLPQIKGSKTFTTISHQGSRVSLSTGTYGELSYGDVVSCTGILQRTDKTSLWKDGVFYEISAKTFKVTAHHRGWAVLAVLYDLKQWFTKRLYETFPSPHGELIAGLTIEGADAISKDLKDQFKRTSLSHIVALSGTNVSIIVEAVFVLLKRTKRSIRFTTGFLFICAFALMTGVTSTILRASLMASMSLVADLFHRTYNPLRALCISTIIMLLWNPLTLMFDISFQLSFMATLSMVLVVPVMELLLYRFIRYELIRETLVTTLSAQVFVLPLILFYSGSLSTIAPVSNLLVLPVIPLAMLFGSLAVPLSYLGPLVFLVEFPAQMIVSYILWVVNFLSSLPFAAYQVQISWYVLVLLYLIIISLLFYAYKKTGVKPVS